MTRTDFLDLLAITAAGPVLSFVIGLIFPRWSTRRVCLIGAGAIPAIIVALCVIVLVAAALQTPEHCGVDACGMASAFAVMGIFGALIAFAVGLALAYVVQRLVRRQRAR